MLCTCGTQQPRTLKELRLPDRHDLDCFRSVQLMTAFLNGSPLRLARLWAFLESFFAGILSCPFFSIEPAFVLVELPVTSRPAVGLGSSIAMA
jgi:hypothetical protein